jgi:hypothetical protein
MSFILDALRRSDRTRRILDAGRDAEPVALPAPRSAPRWALLGAVLVAINLVLVAWWVMRAPVPVAEPRPADPVQPPVVRSLAREAGSAADEGLATDGAPPASEAAAAPVGEAPASVDELPPEVRARFPELHLDAHVWSEDPAQRFVIVGLKRRVAGDALDGGLTLAAIDREGVVVRFEGRAVFVPRR